MCLSIFDAGGSVRGCMCVYTHTPTRTAHGMLDVSQGSGRNTWRARQIQMN